MADEQHEATEGSESDTNALLCEIKKLISDGFMTCESTPDHDYYVKIETRRLVDAQKLHRLLVQISST